MKIQMGRGDGLGEGENAAKDQVAGCRTLTPGYMTMFLRFLKFEFDTKWRVLVVFQTGEIGEEEE